MIHSALNVSSTAAREKLGSTEAAGIKGAVDQIYALNLSGAAARAKLETTQAADIKVGNGFVIFP